MLEDGNLGPFSINFTKPRIGDLIYFPMGNKYFEIKFVKDYDEIFFQLGKIPYYSLQCEVFEYSHEEFNTNIVVSSYPVELKNYRDDIEYEFSYDFLARPRALEVWENLLRFPKKFDIKILVSPQILKTFHPNTILNKLSILPNIKSVEFKEYYRNEITMWNLNNTVYDKFIKLVLSSQLNIPYINLNKEKMRFLNNKSSRVDNSYFDEEYCLLPDNKLYIQHFNEEDISTFQEINEEDIGTLKVNYPEEYNFYSTELKKWSLENDI